MTNAIYKGQLWAKSHTPEEIANSLLKYFPDTDIESLKTVAKRYSEEDAWMSTPVMKKEAFLKLEDVMRTAGELDKEVPFEKVINTDFANNAVSKIK